LDPSGRNTIKYFTVPRCLAADLYRIKVSSHNYCTICKQKSIIMDKEHLLKCPKLDNTARDLPKLYWDD